MMGLMMGLKCCLKGSLSFMSCDTVKPAGNKQMSDFGFVGFQVVQLHGTEYGSTQETP